MDRLNCANAGHVWWLLRGLSLLAVLAGCLPVPAERVVPLVATTVVPLVTATPPATPAELSASPTATVTAVAPEPTATTAPTATSTWTPTPTSTQAPSGASLDVYAVVGVAGDDVLNVRTGPGVGNPIVATIPPYGMGVRTTGEGQLVGQSLWVPVTYGDDVGWVNSRYLARQVGTVDEAVAARAHEIVQALRDKDWGAIASAVHPDLGVRFSPYAYVSADRDRVVRATEIEALATDPTIYRWGNFDGTGDPIDMDFARYVDRFVYDVDFGQPHTVGFGKTVGRGNTIDNIADVFPKATTVEYHFTGFDPNVMGMDWRSLRLVLEEQDGVWYLVGVVHDEWTI